MKHLILLIFLLPVLAVSVIGQEIDTQTLRCQYKLTYVEDSLHPQDVSVDLMVLEQGKRCSKFYSYYAHVRDSVSKADIKAGLSPMERVTNLKKLGIRGTDVVIYKNYPVGKITTVNKIARDYYCFDEPLDVPQWEVKAEYDSILSYRCQKAVCTFLGRTYVAWFAPGVPVNGGPWCFSGLPGLILKVADTRNHYIFQCVGIQAFSSPITFVQQKWFKVSKKEHGKVLRRHYSDVLSSFAESYGVTISMTDETGNAFKPELPYNPIDLTQ
ncbi:GLPGLI family protein [Williamwhitmania taraxaci]|uniref:GLPGLI family protein n=1 Tax=Williamwhitmania taraxaci TaxID=1640674 RepID=A0A1G6JBJ5_9BACT|nr:GLPGLI family protein [Williamwhitmania taraxaci]SDC16108.1 GLPGLI family protein [Williamwhitmania taraxaci]